MIISQDPQRNQPEDQSPKEIKRTASWMGTRFTPRPDGKLNKPPYRVRSGQQAIKADKTDPENRATFEEARAALERGDVDATGFVFTAEDPYTGMDLDDALDPETGEIKLWAAEIVADFPTYWEISVSGTGLRGICIGSKPGARCRKGPVEIYDGRSGARFMVITGRAIGPVSEIRDCQEQINTLYHKLFPKTKRTANAAKARSTNTREGFANATTTGTRLLEPEELLQKARDSRGGKRFIKLFDYGNREGYETPSQADYALINTLIFWCSGDPGYVEEMFRRSALFRPPPEKHRDYVAVSVENCLASYKGRFYSRPNAIHQKPTTKQQDVLAPYLALLLDPSKWIGQKAASAYKAYAGLILLAVEDGISTATDELRIGADIRRLAERAGVNRTTLCRSSLPYLTQDLKLVKWKRGGGSRAGEFVIMKPDLPSGADTKEVHACNTFSVSTYRDSLDSLAQLVRLRSGISRTGRINELGKFETVARLGMVSMFCLVAMTNEPRGLNIDELVGKTGRRKDNVRATMQKLVEAEIVEEPRSDFFTLTAAFWSAYQRALIKSGITAAERNQRRQHAKEKRKHAKELEKGKNRKEREPVDQNVIDMAARRREREDRETLRRQFMERDDLSALTPQQREEKMQEVLMQEYDVMAERTMKRLEVSARTSGRDRATKRRTGRTRGAPGGSTREG